MSSSQSRKKRFPSLGKILYHTYYAPKGFLKKLSNDGVFNSIKTEWGRRQMLKAAKLLPSQQHLPSNDSDIPISVLTGTKYWYQTIFCLHSLQHFSNSRFKFEIYSDGTLQREQLEHISNILGEVKYISSKQALKRVDKFLPSEKYPVLRIRRDEYPHLKKLTDIHVGRKSYHLVLDSDMLFFKKPDSLVKWLNNPNGPICMKDIKTSYGYSKTLLETITKTSIPSKINVGVFGFDSSSIDWNLIQTWIHEIQSSEGTSYFQEQAIAAMFLADQKFNQLSSDQYHCIDKSKPFKLDDYTLNHFVADSKHFYFQKAWRQYLEMINAS